MQQGNMYEISLRATSDMDKPIGIGVHENISSGGPFFFQQIQITQKEKRYGPFPFVYEPMAKMLGIKINVGGDWWESMDAVWDNWTTNYDMGIGRFRFVTPEWEGFNMITLPVDQIRENPPPIAGSTAVDKKSTAEVHGFDQKQNYPNPFNPKTTIEYSIPSMMRVRLQVFDITGRTVATLVNGMRPAGTHIVRFDATNPTSGLYFYRLDSAQQQRVQKMMLVQ